MEEMLQRSWWMLALRGVAAIVFGVLAIVWPDLTLLVLVGLFAAFAFITAAAYIGAALKVRGNDGGGKGWWLLLLWGLVAVAAGGIAIFHPIVTALTLVLLMGANALVTGVLDLVMAFRLRKEIRNEWMLVLAGIVSIVFGVLVLAFPGAGALAMVWMVSFYATLTGVLLLALAIRLRGRAKPSTGTKDRLVGA
ncbi:MAG: HdeD family acid-resistance protein [Usitatibacter sp.]